MLVGQRPAASEALMRCCRLQQRSDLTLLPPDCSSANITQVHCATCAGPEVCTTCKDGYRMVGWSKRSCQPLPPTAQPNQTEYRVDIPPRE